MGEEKDGWMKRRAENEKVKLEDGVGYAGLIMEQIKEVWGVEKKGGDEEEGENGVGEEGQEEKR